MKSKADFFFPFWFYPLLLLGSLGSLSVGVVLLWGSGELFRLTFYWLASR